MQSNFFLTVHMSCLKVIYLFFLYSWIVYQWVGDNGGKKNNFIHQEWLGKLEINNDGDKIAFSFEKGIYEQNWVLDFN